jgi:hypothetical protein
MRFPIGRFDPSVPVSREMRADNIAAIGGLPDLLEAAVEGATEALLNTPYRPGGWTVRQTVHHVADSHINSICRFKLALTEDVPTIRPYFEERWAELADSRLPIGPSLAIIRGVHLRLHALLRSLNDEEFTRELIHPDSGRLTIETLLALYAWHGRHHVAHIESVRASGR